MTDDQSTRLPPTYRPRRQINLPRIDQADRPDSEELERQRRLATKRRVQPRVWR